MAIPHCCLDPATSQALQWPLKRLHSNLVDETFVDFSGYTALYRRLRDLCNQQPLAEPIRPAIHIGIEDAQGSLVHVVRRLMYKQLVPPTGL